MIYRIEISDLEKSGKNEKLLADARDFLGINSLKSVNSRDFYKIKTKCDLNPNQLFEIGHEVLGDQAIQKVHIEADQVMADFLVEVIFRPGVTDNVGKSATTAIGLFLNEEVVSASGKLYYLSGSITKEDAKLFAEKLVANPLIQLIKVKSKADFEAVDRFKQVEWPEPSLVGEGDVAHYDLHAPLEQFDKWNVENCWALNSAELKAIINHFKGHKIQEDRQKLGMDLNPTDVEMEVLAQTWSEHCKHKIFAAEIEYDEDFKDDRLIKLGSNKINSLYKTYIKGATKDVESKRGIDWLISVFSDNAGIVRYDEKVDLCIKVETHNSPSALDPYGGALTGILGVNRDIMGCGLGAKPIGNTDVFCFSQSNWPTEQDKDQLPVNLLHPRRILEGVHKGVEDGGNKSGIPTINGAIYFDYDYIGKPLVYCGTIGVMPQKLKDGRDSHHKDPRPGDYIVCAGGRVGKDGIHGATFSSMKLHDDVPDTVVQIGDPITQKRLLDFTLEARDLGLYTAITDNGAGGISSSVGEMAQFTNGAKLDLSLAPTKYPGLKPFEIMISESQERMTYAVKPSKWDDFKKLAEDRGVEVCNLGTFTDSGYFEVFYKDQRVAYLAMEFMHDGCPQLKLKASFEGAKEKISWRGRLSKEKATEKWQDHVTEALPKLLSSDNIRSKEKWVRQYDHEVQAATHIGPFNGVDEVSPSDSGVLLLKKHGGSENAGVAVGCGLNPKVSFYDTYLMSLYAIDEAVRNVVASGAMLDKCSLIDNFCWPDPVESESTPDGKHKLAQLVRANKGLYDAALAYGTPFISGKDSMKNDFRGKDISGKQMKISVPPTLLITSMAYVEDVHNTVTSSFKDDGQLIYHLGIKEVGLGYSEWAELYDCPKHLEFVPNVDLKKNATLYKAIYQINKSRLMTSCHDISDGGLLVALAECTFATNLGANINVNVENPTNYFFNEGTGRFVCTVTKDNKSKFEQVLKGLDFELIGETTVDSKLIINNQLSFEISDLKKKWSGHGKY